MLSLPLRACEPQDDEITPYIKLGIITAAHGIRGQVKIRSFTEDPRDITAYGQLSDAMGKLLDITVTGGTNDNLIAIVKGVTTRNEAENLRNTELFVPRDALPQTQKHQYYHEDLIGLRLVTGGGEPYGTISAVHNFGAGDLIAVTGNSGEEELVPFSRNTFPRIDVNEGIAVIVPPDIAADE